MAWNKLEWRTSKKIADENEIVEIWYWQVQYNYLTDNTREQGLIEILSRIQGWGKKSFGERFPPLSEPSSFIVQYL